MIDLFGFVDALFCKTTWKNVSDNDKYKHSYMVNRFLSIRYPIEINNCQIVGLGKKNTIRLMNYWHHILSKSYQRPPFWLKTKSGTKKTQNDLLKVFDKEHIAAYSRTYMIDTKTLNDLCQFFPKELVADMKSFNKKDELKKTK